MRLDAVQKLRTLWNLDIEYIEHYGLREFIRSVAHDEGNRCLRCYSTRLEETAQIARKMGLDGFTTSLLASPYQKFDMIINIGKDIGKKYSTRFYAEDFRIGWKEGVTLAKKLGLYRQKYCGCIYSEEEKYSKNQKKLRIQEQNN
jgi:predicted adenine nucleotide alpha hydrolase (AANH) superfamily ATPase